MLNRFRLRKIFTLRSDGLKYRIIVRLSLLIQSVKHHRNMLINETITMIKQGGGMVTNTSDTDNNRC